AVAALGSHGLLPARPAVVVGGGSRGLRGGVDPRSEGGTALAAARRGGPGADAARVGRRSGVAAGSHGVRARRGGAGDGRAGTAGAGVVRLGALAGRDRSVGAGPLLVGVRLVGAARGRRLVAVGRGGQGLEGGVVGRLGGPLGGPPGGELRGGGGGQLVGGASGAGFGGGGERDVGAEFGGADLDEIVALLAQGAGDRPAAVGRDLHDGDADAEFLRVAHDLGEVFVAA